MSLFIHRVRGLFLDMVTFCTICYSSFPSLSSFDADSFCTTLGRHRRTEFVSAGQRLTKLLILLIIRSSANANTKVRPLQKYYRGTPNIWELPYAKATPTFPLGVVFMVGLGKPKLYSKFEVASFSHCRNFGELP